MIGYLATSAFISTLYYVGSQQQAIVSATTRTRSYDVATGNVSWEGGGQTMNVIPMPATGHGLVSLASGFRGNSPQAIKLTAKGEVAFLWDDVRITRAATPERPEMLARSPDLTVHTEAGFAFTNSPVEITQGQSWITGVGAEIDNNKSTFVLQS